MSVKSKRHPTKTDNSYFYGKVILREYLLELSGKRKFYVLDCFAGEGRIWQEIRKRNVYEISILPLEIERNKNKLAVVGDNRKILPQIDLSVFDVIDIDAYGSSFDVLSLVFSKKLKPNCLIFTTDIRVVYGGVSHGLLHKIGITERMIKKVGTMFYGFSDKAFDTFLYDMGVRTYYEYAPKNNKKYRGFFVP